MKYLKDLLAEASTVPEIFPWDLDDWLREGKDLLVIDVREPAEYQAMHISGSLLVPRGILESACSWGYDDTVPVLAAARQKTIVIVCRSGNRSLLAGQTLQKMGYTDVYSLKTGLRGWNDSELPLADSQENRVDPDQADQFFLSRVSKEQIAPQE